MRIPLKCCIASALFCLANALSAQDWLISFTGTGAAATVDSVKVENITQCTDTSFPGTDTLHLLGIVGIDEQPSALSNLLLTWPVPAAGSCFAGFEMPSGGEAQITLHDAAGRLVCREAKMLDKGTHLFSITGLHGGVFYLWIGSASSSCSAKIISTGGDNSKPVIRYIEQDLSNGPIRSGSAGQPAKKPTRTESLVDMQYNPGDLLKITGKSGIYCTIMMLVPTQSQAVTFEFTDCTDNDGNHYAVVQIGSQLWMAGNLKATHYRDGTAIPEVPDSATWGSLSTGAWCNFHNDPLEGEKYGHLYNWYAAADPRNIAPAGWHIFSDDEWTVLDNFLGGDSIAGQKLKENCETRWAYLDTTWGTNVVGFTALCANFRTAPGGWSLAPNNDHDTFYWSSTEFSTTSAYAESLRWCFRDVWRSGYVWKKHGSSLRCIHD